MTSRRPPEPLDEFLTLAELSRLLKLSRRTVRERLMRDGVPAFVLSEKRNSSVRYARRDVERWLETCRLRQKVIDAPVPGDELVLKDGAS